MAKVKALYDYVSRNIRYVSLSFGLGRIQPHAASEVLANGYGDCKDKNTLLAALLDAEGFHSTSVLIGSQDQARSRYSVALAVRPRNNPRARRWQRNMAGQHSRRGAVPHVVANLRDKQALAIPPNGNADTGMDAEGVAVPGLRSHSLVGTVNDTGELKAHVSTASRGDTEMVLRYGMRRMPSSHWKDIFEYMLKRANMHGCGDHQPEGQRSQRHRRSPQRRLRRDREELLQLVRGGVKFCAAPGIDTRACGQRRRG